MFFSKDSIFEDHVGSFSLVTTFQKCLAKLQNAGPLLKLYKLSWLGGSLVISKDILFSWLGGSAVKATDEPPSRRATEPSSHRAVEPLKYISYLFFYPWKRLTIHRAVEPLKYYIPYSFLNTHLDWRAVEPPSHWIISLQKWPCIL